MPREIPLGLAMVFRQYLPITFVNSYLHKQSLKPIYGALPSVDFRLPLTGLLELEYTMFTPGVLGFGGACLNGQLTVCGNYYYPMKQDQEKFSLTLKTFCGMISP
jgi:hypothetical protein